VDHLSLNGLLDGRSGLARWYEQVQTMPSYQSAVADFLIAPAIAGFRKAGEAVADEVAKVLGG
jgi:hypothetical protein